MTTTESLRNMLIPAWLLQHVELRGEQPALWIHQGEEFQSINWAELGREVAQAATLLQELDIQPGDRVASVSENRREWIVLDLALLLIRAVHVPIHATLAGPQILHQITDSGAKLLVLSGQEQADKLTACCDELSANITCLSFDAFKGGITDQLHCLNWATRLSEVKACHAIFDYADQIQKIDAADLATIMYTSGTTGHPRGVMLSQGNLANNAAATAEAYPYLESELRLGFLPLSHIYARTCDLYAWLYRGSQFALAQSRDTILADCQAIHPTTINGVPYFYDKIFRRLHESGQQPEQGVVQKLLGGKVRHCFCGGAALPEHVETFFAEQEQPILAGYGLSETSPVISVSTKAESRPGAVGRPLSNIEVRFAEDGELLTRGPHVMQGYWQDEAATLAVIQEGWLHTGDLGRLDEDGFLYITGRKKEILVTALGKKVEPTAIERLLTASPLILQAMVIGEGRNYLSALIVPNPDQLRTEIKARRLWVFSRRGALRHKKVQAMYRAELDRLLKGISRHEQIGQFLLLGRGFTIESGELTPKGSLRREVILNNLAVEIEQLYAKR